MLYVGLDISSTKIGICTIDLDAKKVYCNTIGRLTHKKSFNVYIHPIEMSSQVLSYIKLREVVGEFKLVVEEYRPGRNKANQWQPVWMQGFIVGSILANTKFKPNIEYVNQYIWKKNLIGRKTSGKAMVEETTYIRCKELGLSLELDSKEEDSYDAFGIAYWGMRNKEVEVEEKLKLF